MPDYLLLLQVSRDGLHSQEYSYRNLIVYVLRDKLSYLSLEERDLQVFADAFASDYGTIGYKGHLLALSRPFLSLVDKVRGDEITRFEDRVVSEFLLSSDFFRNAADETRPVRYVAYYNPYNLACANPFAVLNDV